ncbi:MAG TPA: cell division protein CrgA [Acidimicrobiales bacterium]
MAKTQRSGRTTPRAHRGTTTGKYMSAEQTGRYTRPIPKDTRTSPRWYGFLVVGLLILGALLLVGNYLSFLPGAVSPWYLVAGLASIFVGFALSTRLR